MCSIWVMRPPNQFNHSFLVRLRTWPHRTCAVTRMLHADFERAVQVFVPGQAHPKSAQHLSLAFGVVFRDCWLPARSTQFSMPVIQELCRAISLVPADVFKVAWVFRSWLGDFSGMGIPRTYLPVQPPVMSVRAACSASGADAMIEVLERHMEELERCEPQAPNTAQLLLLYKHSECSDAEHLSSVVSRSGCARDGSMCGIPGAGVVLVVGCCPSCSPQKAVAGRGPAIASVQHLRHRKSHGTTGADVARCGAGRRTRAGGS